MLAMRVDELMRGRAQPFYHCLVDERDRSGSQVTYVAQENILPASPAEQVQHKAVDDLLYRFDEQRGFYEPLPQLKEQYPASCAGCWMVDAVIPDQPATE
jgi:heat shock protein HspQ